MPHENSKDDPVRITDETREWLENLREEDLRDIKAAADFVKTLKTVTKVNRYLLFVFLGAFVLMAQFGEAIAKFIGWIRGQ